jgi:sporulation protein YlmC with PRC-barrel domain
VSESTEFTIGASASCSDGYCGEVSRVIIDPAAGTVTHLVIDPEHRREAGRLVPLDLVDATADEIRLRCTLAQFNRLEHAAERDMVEGLANVGGGLIGMEYGTDLAHRGTVVEDVVPVGETEVGPGEHVHALDGEIGRVQGFLVNPDDHQVTHVLLQEGHLWGRKEVAIPIAAVTQVDGGIRLNITKKQVEDLPRAD